MDNKILNLKNILLNQKATGKIEAIERAGKLLINNGYVNENYIDGMKAREEVVSTYLGNGVAIPHAVNEYKKEILKTGIVILQYPEGVDFGDENIAYVLIGIASNEDEHIEILSKIALVVSEEKNVDRLRRASTKEDVIRILKEGEF